ncbi:hypothetical protein Tco_0323677 [Tanacetum coccineum]
MVKTPKNKNVDITPRYKNDNQTGQFGNLRTMIVAGARETVDQVDWLGHGYRGDLMSRIGSTLAAHMAKDPGGSTATQEHRAHWNQDDSNVTLDSPDMCDNDIQTDQNAKDERAALANLITNLKLDVDENKKIQK